ncbi:AraC family transcriptional regulator [Oceanidesulfovibrio marinus]|uniref:AraC family transcriptional regulator n=1 Tax=Oceanidesulfovibrio marinus TaxID=370038 RepID=A0A6P1ZQU1_9BACT|nr:AraC family transcriptional regulator [Oceanidesulfovibrio marinus]QJT08727.1 AraC family transcriptional regulator [Oceanidesulfovibrio marinus]TVM36845.1 AraC family transcriptional regulator [Oceanidesulfovibrio marinus]
MHESYIPYPEGHGLNGARSALAEKLGRLTGKECHLETPVPGLWLNKCTAPTEPASYMHEPSICLVAQGAKRVLLGEDEYRYDAHHSLITSVGLPVVSQVTEATEETPYLGLKLKLDLRMVAQLMVDSNLPVARAQQAQRGIAVSEVSLPLLGAFLRLLDLLDTPQDIPILAPLVQREIAYRLLVGSQGPRLRQIAAAGSHSHQIARAIDWLKLNYTQQLRVDDLAAHTGMSTSSFHHHFRALTAMSPLQFQKWIRLHEARRLMLMDHLDATSAALQVGYESASQFSREYSRLFGAPPLRDIKRLHQMAQLETAQLGN